MASKTLSVLRAQIIANVFTNTGKTVSGDIMQAQLLDLLDSVVGKQLSVFGALSGQPPASNYATFDTRNSIAVLDFDDTVSESTVFVGVIQTPAPLTSITVRIHWMATSATSGNVRWGAAVEKCNTDLDADSFDTATEATGSASSTCGIVTVTSITLTTADAIAEGDLFRLKIYRAAADAVNDTMVGDAEIVAVEVRGA